MPKVDNSNTPIRPQCNPSGISAGTEDNSFVDEAPDNITMRVKSDKIMGDPSCAIHSMDSLRALIRQEMKEVLVEYAKSNLEGPLREIKIIKEELRAIKEELRTYQDSMSFINDKYEELKTECSLKFNKVHELSEENKRLSSTVNKLTIQLNQLDQLTRSTNLEVQCVPESKNENVVKLVEQLARTVKCPITANDIHYCSRIAKKTSDNSRPRSVLIKLSSPRLRDTLLAAVIQYNKNNPKEKLQTRDLGIGGSKSTPVYVTEHLSPENKSLHAAARQKGKELQYKYVWIRAGKIFMRKDDSTPYVFIRDRDTLVKLE